MIFVGVAERGISRRLLDKSWQGDRCKDKNKIQDREGGGGLTLMLFKAKIVDDADGEEDRGFRY